MKITEHDSTQEVSLSSLGIGRAFRCYFGHDVKIAIKLSDTGGKPIRAQVLDTRGLTYQYELPRHLDVFPIEITELHYHKI